jgi:hypothetical protein
MKTINVSEASGQTLDWLVAKCEEQRGVKFGTGFSGEMLLLDEHEFGHRLDYSTNWARGGPIVNQMLVDGLQLKLNEYPRGECTKFVASLPTPTVFNFGPTPLIAAMRCYCVSRLGNTAEVPDELY